MNLKRIDVYWEGPYNIVYERECSQYRLASDVPEDIRTSSGVYQIYGDHPVYGRGSLLYIGETKPSESNRSFDKRLKEHLNGRFWYHHGLFVHFGSISHRDNIVDNSSEVQAVESLLIASNMPALNRKHLDKPISSSKNLLVRNWNFKGSIVAECSGEYWGA